MDTDEPHSADLPRGLMNFSVRQVRRDDAPRLSEFYRSLSARSSYFFEPYTDTSVEAMRTVVDRAMDGYDLSLVANEHGGRVFAHFFYMNVSADVPHLGIGLRDEYQELGLGSMFMAYLLALGRNVLQKRSVGLTVLKENERALKLYTRLGFEIVRDHTFRHPDDSVEMQLDLHAPQEVIR
ncbi:MAG: GNAT family N-acetyltransferase [FCB group bacterium]|jgi:ribosomal protein S18 acetylase RimI-like enzyme|nr:GNAT family N-acetyltransferase [FCB group bacterium]